MKQIENVTIWKNGEMKTASILNAYIVNDNLQTSCFFYYQLSEGGQGTEEMPLIVGNSLAEGNVLMDEEAYLAWDGSNNSAYAYIAGQLNLTLV